MTHPRRWLSCEKSCREFNNKLRRLTSMRQEWVNLWLLLSPTDTFNMNLTSKERQHLWPNLHMESSSNLPFGLAARCQLPFLQRCPFLISAVTGWHQTQNQRYLNLRKGFDRFRWSRDSQSNIYSTGINLSIIDFWRQKRIWQAA